MTKHFSDEYSLSIPAEEAREDDYLVLDPFETLAVMSLIRGHIENLQYRRKKYIADYYVKNPENERVKKFDEVIESYEILENQLKEKMGK